MSPLKMHKNLPQNLEVFFEKKNWKQILSYLKKFQSNFFSFGQKQLI